MTRLNPTLTVTTDISDVNPPVNDVNKLDNVLNPKIVDSIFTDVNPSINSIDDANKNVISIPVSSDANTTVNVPVDSEADMNVSNLVDSNKDTTVVVSADNSANTIVNTSVDSNVKTTTNTSVKTTLDDTKLSRLTELFPQPEQIDWNGLINLAL